MNPIERISYWRRARALKRWNAGFDHAAGRLLRGIPPHEACYADEDGDTLDAFDSGMRSAVAAWNRRPYAQREGKPNAR